MVIPSPGQYADPELHWGLGSVVLVYDIDTRFELDPPIFSMRLEDQTPFVQQLHGSGCRRFIEVTTWYLDGVVVPYNDQQR